MISLFSTSDSVLHLDDGPVSARTIADEGRRLAAALAARGVAEGDRIAIWAANGRSYLQTIAALAIGGQVVVSINTRFGHDEAWSIVDRSGAELLISDRTADSAIDEVTVLPTEDLPGLIAESPDRAEGRGGPDSPFLVFTTSGTTSRPKLVLHTQRSITDHASDLPPRFGFDRTSRIMVALPLCGAFGFAGLIGGLAASADLWLPAHFDADEAARLVETERITAMNGSDDMFHRMLASGHDLSSIETAGYARFNSSLTDIVGTAEQAGLRLTGLYGMSEVQAMFSTRDRDGSAADRELGGGSLTSPLARARVVDPETGSVLPPGEDGELQLRGPSLFVGYLAEGGAAIDPILTEAAHQVDPDGDRWFRTGDLGRMDSEGSFTYLSRMGDVLRLGGFLVSPAEIEDALVACAGVAEAQVVAVGRPEGVRPVAVVIASEAGVLDESGIIRDCGRRLARFKTPVRVIEVAEFPTTQSANGTKIQRNKIQQIAEDALAS